MLDNLARWTTALSKAPTTGASQVTAQQAHLPAGVESSHAMAEADLQRVRKIADVLMEVGNALDVPAALIAGLASRESRCGSALDAQGFGDHGNAFGILQVDRRFHNLQGIEQGPASRDHIAQAIGILADFRRQLQTKHPDWEDQFIIKGCAVAYNSGVSNVVTKERMDAGTTGNDYGSDVIARAQFYANRL